MQERCDGCLYGPVCQTDFTYTVIYGTSDDRQTNDFNKLSN